MLTAFQPPCLPGIGAIPMFSFLKTAMTSPSPLSSPQVVTLLLHQRASNQQQQQQLLTAQQLWQVQQQQELTLLQLQPELLPVLVLVSSRRQSRKWQSQRASLSLVSVFMCGGTVNGP